MSEVWRIAKILAWGIAGMFTLTLAAAFAYGLLVYLLILLAFAGGDPGSD